MGGGEEAGAQPHPGPSTPPPAGETDAVALGYGLVPNFPSAPHTDPPSVSAVNGVVLAAKGEEAVLECEATGVPPPRVIWYRGTCIGWGEGLQKGPAGGPEGSAFQDSHEGTWNGVSGENGLFQAAPVTPSPVSTYN